MDEGDAEKRSAHPRVLARARRPPKAWRARVAAEHANRARRPSRSLLSSRPSLPPPRQVLPPPRRVLPPPRQALRAIVPRSSDADPRSRLAGPRARETARCGSACPGTAPITAAPRQTTSPGPAACSSPMSRDVFGRSDDDCPGSRSKIPAGQNESRAGQLDPRRGQEHSGVGQHDSEAGAGALRRGAARRRRGASRDGAGVEAFRSGSARFRGEGGRIPAGTHHGRGPGHAQPAYSVPGAPEKAQGAELHRPNARVNEVRSA